MNLTYYMLEIYLTISIKVKVPYFNYLGYAQQTITFTLYKGAETRERETLKITWIEFKGKMLVIEKTKTSPKAKSINGVNQRYMSTGTASAIRLWPNLKTL